MYSANSAKGYVSLGATLIAIASTASAGNDGSTALGITTGDVLGITTGDTLGITTGDVLGITTGDTLGITTGDVLGDHHRRYARHNDR